MPKLFLVFSFVFPETRQFQMETWIGVAQNHRPQTTDHRPDTG